MSCLALFLSRPCAFTNRGRKSDGLDAIVLNEEATQFCVLQPCLHQSTTWGATACLFSPLGQCLSLAVPLQSR